MRQLQCHCRPAYPATIAIVSKVRDRITEAIYCDVIAVIIKIPRNLLHSINSRPRNKTWVHVGSWISDKYSVAVPLVVSGDTSISHITRQAFLKKLTLQAESRCWLRSILIVMNDVMVHLYIELVLMQMSRRWYSDALWTLVNSESSCIKGSMHREICFIVAPAGLRGDHRWKEA